MRALFSLCVWVVVSSLVIASTAVAGPLGMDPDGIPAFTGTVSFSATDGASNLLADVDYAVFAPGDFSGADPSGGAEFVYAYQTFNVGAAGDKVFSALSVGLLAGSNATGGSAGDDPGYPLVGGISPSGASVGVDSVLFSFAAPQVIPGEFTTVVLFTSPNEPTFGVGSVIDGGLSDQQPVPTPVPEPATLALLGVAGLAMLRRRR